MPRSFLRTQPFVVSSVAPPVDRSFMGRTPCCDKGKVKRGPWSPEEDMVLRNYIERQGTAGNWIALPQKAGLSRCGKSCRLRWLNYLRPDIKHGGFTKEEDDAICSMYSSIGSRWSVIASHLSGRTDNEVKNHWNTKLKKRMMAAQVTNSYTTATPTDQSPSSSTVKNEASSNEPWFDFSSLVATEDSSGSSFFSNWNWTKGSGDIDALLLDLGGQLPVEFQNGSSIADPKMAETNTNFLRHA